MAIGITQTDKESSFEAVDPIFKVRVSKMGLNDLASVKLSGSFGDWLLG